MTTKVTATASVTLVRRTATMIVAVMTAYVGLKHNFNSNGKQGSRIISGRGYNNMLITSSHFSL